MTLSERRFQKMIRSKLASLVVILMVVMIGSTTNVKAETVDSEKTEIGVNFKEDTEIIISNPPKDIVYEPPSKPIYGSPLLPKTGELITSFIITLIGLSLVIVVIGVTFLRRIYIDERLVI